MGQLRCMLHGDSNTYMKSAVGFVHACFQAGLEKAGCGITKYSSSHSFNPLLLSKSAVNLSVQKVGTLRVQRAVP